ncbi:MAG: class I SAM-dependent methyltransferase [Gammaproteobacteria bacterium]|nr:class I SAM-dependent methyltransferase [Gammaproteobacteria bacterium]
MARNFCFDERFYREYYIDPRTRVMGPEDYRRLGNFVCSYLKYMDQPVRRVLDIGCGLGRWRAVLRRHFPHACYTGVEISEYACRRYGWERGSVVDYRARRPFDLVICQAVLQYLTGREAQAALGNLARLCRGALYLDVMTREDWGEDCARASVDGDVYLRSGSWYRRRLVRHFVNAGGGVFVRRSAPATLFDLEQLK